MKKRMTIAGLVILSILLVIIKFFLSPGHEFPWYTYVVFGSGVLAYVMLFVLVLKYLNEGERQDTCVSLKEMQDLKYLFTTLLVIGCVFILASLVIGATLGLCFLASCGWVIIIVIVSSFMLLVEAKRKR